jgi:hypothetical protein
MRILDLNRRMTAIRALNRTCFSMGENRTISATVVAAYTALRP